LAKGELLLPTLLAQKFPTEVGKSSSLMNQLLRRARGTRHYLEIGIASGKTIVNVQADLAVGVDPFPEVRTVPTNCIIHQVSSRDFFKSKAMIAAPYSVIFVDGLHLWEECLEDILLSFDNLAEFGFVAVDDTYPSGEAEAVRAQTYEEAVLLGRKSGREIEGWMGDVWRAAFVLTHAGIPGLRWATVPIKQSRYHTVFWWSRQESASQRVRDFITAELLLEGGAVPVSVVGDFTRRGMAEWYRYQPYWRFLLFQRLRELAWWA
jgi:hypothetical protein